MNEVEQLEKAIAALEAQRAFLGDDVVNTALAPLREKMASYRAKDQTSDPQRKYVTVLFTDITGSTNMSQRLDPEDMMTIMDGAMQRFNKVIQKYEGRVLNFMGDGLMAIFGTPVAREDDTERAVLAGLGLIEDARAYAEQIEEEWDLGGFNVRVGLDTGPVILGGGVDDDNTAVGMTINLAARMESAAPIGGLRMTNDTYRHVHGLFDVQAQSPIKVKGKDEPILTYVVQGIRPKVFRTVTRGLEGIQTKMIGREVEFEQLKDAFRTTMQDGKTQIVTIAGEPGVGKSRLLYEFETWLGGWPKPIRRYQARAVEPMMRTPYSLLRDLFAFRFNILDSDSVTTVRQKLEDGLLDHLDREGLMKAHFIGALLGYDFSNSPYLQAVQNDPRQLRDRASLYLSHYFSTVANEVPTVILLDDLHWADDPSLDAIHFLAGQHSRLPLLFLCLTRQILFERRPAWGEGMGKAQITQINLHPLTEQNSSQLVQEILKNADSVPEALSRLIVSSAEGNPFYVEELIKILIDDGVILKDDTTRIWRIDEAKLSSMRVPPTLTAVLQARLDSLPNVERNTLQQASVVGRTFWDAILQVLREGDKKLATVLQTLADREMIYEQPLSTFSEAGEYLFKHALLRDVTYETVLKRKRRIYHAQVAGWLAETTQTSKRGAEYATLIGEHYYLAGEYRLAADWFLQAGERAMGQGTPLEARELFDRALELLPSDERERRWRGLLGRNEVLGMLGESEARKADGDALLILAQEEGDDDWLASAYYRSGTAADHLGYHQEALLDYEQALSAACSAGNHKLETLVLGAKLVSLSRLGEFEAAAVEAEKVLARVHELDNDAILARMLTNTAIYFTSIGDLALGVELYNQAAVVAQRMKDRFGEALVLGNLGYSYVLLGLPDVGLAVLEQAITIAEAIGIRQQQAYNQLNLGLALIRSGDAGIAKGVLEQSIPDLETLGDVFGRATNLSYLALALEQSGELNNATQRFEEAREILNEIGAKGYANDALSGLARCLYGQGKVDEAQELVETLWRDLTDQGVQGMEFSTLAYKTCAEIFFSLGDSEQAGDAIEAGYWDLMDRAERISNLAWRKSYLQNVPEHRTIIEMWQQLDK